MTHVPAEYILHIEKICGHTFADKTLVCAALTHPSAIEGLPVSASYERLEFLGDSILGAIIATELFERYPDVDEGELTRLKISLVSGKTLSEVSDQLGIGKCIVFGESEKGTGARGMHSALENVYESVVGALYLDGGYNDTHAFVMRTLGPRVSRNTHVQTESPKSRLQEVTQKHFKCAPEYKLEDTQGPAHNPTFTSVVLVSGRRLGRGIGSSKKEAESEAAANALAQLAEEGIPCT